jgi:phospholipid/cholesterol/gamma-HCH transport system substrate-binding protein
VDWRKIRRAAYASAALVCTALVSGCQFTGFGSLSLPLTKGTGSGTYTITAEMSDVTNLPPNSEVMVNDVTVGTVTAITFSDWHADLTISLPDSVKLPANATATIGQKSLLGAEYVALAPPAGSTRPQGTLTDGDVIPLSRTSAYPTTENVLAAMSTLLNGGGLNQLSTITRELNSALAGNEGQYRELLTNLSVFAGSLNTQKTQIIATISSVNQLAAEVKSQDQELTSAIDGIPSGLTVLDNDEGDLDQALSAVSNLSTVADQVINESGGDLEANLQALQPALQQLADSSTNLVQGLDVTATFPWPTSAAIHSTQGDYDNVYIILDLTPQTLDKDWLSNGISLGSSSSSSSSSTDKPSSSKNNPITNIVGGITGGTNSSSGSNSSSGGSSSSSSGGSSGGSGSGGIIGSILGGL